MTAFPDSAGNLQRSVVQSGLFSSDELGAIQHQRREAPCLMKEGSGPRRVTATFTALAVSLMWLGMPSTASACMPVPPLFYVLSGASILDDRFSLGVWISLAVAVAIKTFAFTRFESRVTTMTATLWMLGANVVSTVPGVVIASMGSLAPGGGLVSGILLGIVVAIRLKKLGRDNRHSILAGCATVGVTLVCFAITYVLFRDARAMELSNHPPLPLYWIKRLVCVSLLATAGIVISAVLEEASIAIFARKRTELISFFPAVARANYVTLAVLLVVSAMRVVPERLKDPQFLTTHVLRQQTAPRPGM